MVLFGSLFYYSYVKYTAYADQKEFEKETFIGMEETSIGSAIVRKFSNSAKPKKKMSELEQLFVDDEGDPFPDDENRPGETLFHG